MSTSVFEIIGPIMVGPSSSHTAGMVRIGMMAYRIAGFMPVNITLRLSPTLRTTYRGHRTDAALVGGAMGWQEDDSRLREALSFAKEHDIAVSIDFFPPNLYHPNTAQLELTSYAGEKVSVRGVSIGGGSIAIEAVDDQPLKLQPEQYHLLLWNDTGKITAHNFLQRPSDDLLKKAATAIDIKKVRLVKPVLTYGASISEDIRLVRCEDAIASCRQKGITLAQLAVEYETMRSGFSTEHIYDLMHRQLLVMRESVQHGLEEKNNMLYGLTSGEDGRRLWRVCTSGTTISGGMVPKAVARALAVMEHNASMGRLVAAPTAGSAGIVPGSMLTVQEEYGFTDRRIVDALFAGALIGVIMSHRDVSFSGSVGGCQGEVGVSSAITAAGLASLFNDDPAVPFQAMSICLKNLLGLVCDPIAGPIEVPCIKRNAVGVANAFISSEMACAGIESYLPPDQVIDALIDVEKRLPKELRCTTTGGLACAEKAVCLRSQLAAELQ